MLNQILADYYEEKGFINKSLRLRNHKPLVIFGFKSYYSTSILERLFHMPRTMNGIYFCYDMPNGLGYSTPCNGETYGDGSYYR